MHKNSNTLSSLTKKDVYIKCIILGGFFHMVGREGRQEEEEEEEVALFHMRQRSHRTKRRREKNE